MTENRKYIIDDKDILVVRHECIHSENTDPCPEDCPYFDVKETDCTLDIEEYLRSNPIGDAITLTPSLTQHYTERSQATGKPVQVLVLQDLAALHRKRVAREDRRVFRENEFERL
jgi:hypothetical protein